ncbi:hypothetical protein pb186bvf_009211 [Paramecium bursaria]
MDHQEMSQFMINQMENKDQISNIYEKFNYQFSLGEQQISQGINQIKENQILIQDEYQQKQICREGKLIKPKRSIFETCWKIIRSDILNIQNNRDEALKSLDLSIKLNPNFELPYLKKAQIICQLLQFSKYDAIECLDQFLKINPNSQQSLYDIGKDFKRFLAQILYNLKEYEDALQCLDQCIQINTNFEQAFAKRVILFFMLAQILKKLNFSEYELKCSQWIKFHPTSLEGYCNLARILWEQQSIQEAILCWDKCLEENPTYTEAYVWKAQLLQGNNIEAIKCWNKCINLNPNFEQAYCQKAMILIDQKNYKEALEFIGQIRQRLIIIGFKQKRFKIQGLTIQIVIYKNQKNGAQNFQQSSYSDQRTNFFSLSLYEITFILHNFFISQVLNYTLKSHILYLK